MTEASATKKIVSPNGTVSYIDSRDHFENGLLRLMNMTEKEFLRWLELSQDFEGLDLLGKLRAGYQTLRGYDGAKPELAPVGGPGGQSGKVLLSWIGENPAYGIGVDDAGELGWLIKKVGGESYCLENSPPVYDEQYFEGDSQKAGGYGKYLEQSNWRLEKAQRQVEEITKVTGLRSGNVLDIGAGYGYFRKALGEADFAHDGIEVSHHACSSAEKLYGFRTYQGSLEEYAESLQEKYDLITLWDLIEHVTTPLEFMKLAASCLKREGFLALKTPNLTCPEAILFGPYYHSFKREHLYYFTHQSIERLARLTGLTPFYMTSLSHLLLGFVGQGQCNTWAQAMQGADLYCVLRKN